MFKYLRCDKQILHYNKCLEEEPMYIPRKFWNDKTYTMNDQEKNTYNKLALEKLKTEMEILTNRQGDTFETALIPLSKKLNNFHITRA